jgi:hypothetical protein
LFFGGDAVPAEGERRRRSPRRPTHAPSQPIIRETTRPRQRRDHLRQLLVVVVTVTRRAATQRLRHAAAVGVGSVNRPLTTGQQDHGTTDTGQ